MIRAVRLVWPHLSPALTQARIAPSYYDATILEISGIPGLPGTSSPLPFPFGSHGWMSELVLPFVVLYPCWTAVFDWLGENLPDWGCWWLV